VTRDLQSDRDAVEARFAEIFAYLDFLSRPWLIVTARNLLLSERRGEPEAGKQPLGDIDLAAPADELPFEPVASTCRVPPLRGPR
jgi:hypothetical protein